MILEKILGAAGASAGTQLLKSGWEQMKESGDEDMTAEQLATIGILKSSHVLYPELGDVGDAMKAFFEDYETLRYSGISGKNAFELTQFIYAPRVYLSRMEGFPNAVIFGLDSEEAELIVENALTGFLASRGVSVSDDLVFDVAGIEDNLADVEDDDFESVFSLVFED